MFPNVASASTLQVTLGTRIYLLSDHLCALSVAVITLYCWIFTFDEEVTRVWKGRVTGATVMFILNRYLGLLYSTLSAIQGVVSLSDKSCAMLLPAVDTLGQVLALVSAAFTALRVFALSKKSWSLAVVCFLVPIPSIALSILILQGLLVTAKSMGPGLGCAYISTGSTVNAAAFIFLWSERSSPLTLALSILSCLIADGQLIYLTWIAIAPLRGIGATNLTRGTSLLHVFLRNEILYFIIIVGANVVTFAIEIVYLLNPAKNYTYIASFTGMIPCLLISQFLLELQAADSRAYAGESQFSSANSHVSSVVFDRVVGSIGLASLTPAEDEDDVGAMDEVDSGEPSDGISLWQSGDDNWGASQVAVKDNYSSTQPA